MLFNPDPTKEATEVCFSHKRDNVPHDPLTFNNNKIIGTMRRLSMTPSRKSLLTIYKLLDHS